MKKVLEIKETAMAIKNPSDVFDRVKKVNIDFDQENFIIVYLDTKNKILDSEVLFKGGLNMCIIDPKTIFRHALLKNSNSIIIAHNHPSGHLEPSQEDWEIFEKLQKIGEDLQLKVLDSVIFNPSEYYSMTQ